MVTTGASRQPARRRFNSDKTLKHDRGPITVMFVPRTPGGVLLDMIREAEEMMNQLF